MPASLGQKRELKFSELQTRHKIFTGSFGIWIAAMGLILILIVLRGKGASAEGTLFIETLPTIFGVFCAALVLSGYALWVLAKKIQQG